MGRRPRHDVEGGIHHVMNRGVDHQPIFFGDADRVEFGRRLAEIHDRHAVDTLAYCLMDNHFHLLLRATNGGLSEAMQHFGLVYTRHTNDRVGRDGPLFRGRFNSILVTTDAYLLRATRYIHRNPFAIDGVASPADFRWSSYRTYLGLRRTAPFLDTDLVLGLFGNDRAAFAEFTESPDGSDERAAIETVDDLLHTVRFSIARDDLLRGDEQSSPLRAERTLLILLGLQYSGTPLGNEIQRALKFPTPTAQRMAVSRAKRHALVPGIARVLQDITRAAA